MPFTSRLTTSERKDLTGVLSGLKAIFKFVFKEEFSSPLVARCLVLKNIADSWNQPAKKPAPDSAAIQSPLIDLIGEIDSILASGSITDLQQKVIKEKLEQIRAWAEQQNQKAALIDGGMRLSPAQIESRKAMSAALAQPINFNQLSKHQRTTPVRKGN